MAEIKSTMELIMERTNNLTMTDKEKESLQKKEGEEKIGGLIRKYLGDRISVSTFKSEIEQSEKTFAEFRQTMETALLNHLQPESENTKILKALEQALDINTEPLQKKISQFQKEMNQERSKIIESLRDALKKRGISGSAVMPNPSQDETLQLTLQKMKEAFKIQVTLLRDN